MIRCTTTVKIFPPRWKRCHPRRKRGTTVGPWAFSPNNYEKTGIPREKYTTSLSYYSFPPVTQTSLEKKKNQVAVEWFMETSELVSGEYHQTYLEHLSNCVCHVYTGQREWANEEKRGMIKVRDGESRSGPEGLRGRFNQWMPGIPRTSIRRKE